MMRRVLHGAHALSAAGDTFAFERALRAPGEAQEALFQRLLRTTSGTARGREFGVREGMSLRDFKSQVPVASYEDFEPYVARIARGELDVLTRDPIVMMERSGGSTGTTKLVPYNAGQFAAFRRGTSPWLFDMMRRYPATRRGRSYWSISHAVRSPERTAGGLRIGLENDAEYLGAAGRFVADRIFAVPASVANLPTFEAWREATWLALLEARDLSLLSVWSPTFLTVLLDALEARWPELRLRLSRARREELTALFGEHFCAKATWPKLGLISAWADGSARTYVPGLRSRFPGVPFQPKGLLATEGVVSIPYGPEEHEGAVVAVTSQLLEFLPVDDDGAIGDRSVRVDELVPGQRYSPVMSSPNGFLRYRLQDAVRCVGTLHRTPRVRFEGGELDRTSDLCGEKITEAQATHAVAHARDVTGKSPRFAMLLPVPEPMAHYALALEGAGSAAELAAFGSAVEGYLARGHHYRYARDLGQLGSLRAVAVERGWERYAHAAANAGRKAGDLKPTALETKAFAREALLELACL